MDSPLIQGGSEFGDERGQSDARTGHPSATSSITITLVLSSFVAMCAYFVAGFAVSSYERKKCNRTL